MVKLAITLVGNSICPKSVELSSHVVEAPFLERQSRLSRSKVISISMLLFLIAEQPMIQATEDLE